MFLRILEVVLCILEPDARTVQLFTCSYMRLTLERVGVLFGFVLLTLIE